MFVRMINQTLNTNPVVRSDASRWVFVVGWIALGICGRMDRAG